MCLQFKGKVGPQKIVNRSEWAILVEVGRPEC